MSTVWFDLDTLLILFKYGECRWIYLGTILFIIFDPCSEFELGVELDCTTIWSSDRYMWFIGIWYTIEVLSYHVVVSVVIIKNDITEDIISLCFRRYLSIYSLFHLIQSTKECDLFWTEVARKFFWMLLQKIIKITCSHNILCLFEIKTSDIFIKELDIIESLHKLSDISGSDLYSFWRLCSD